MEIDNKDDEFNGFPINGRKHSKKRKNIDEGDEHLRASKKKKRGKAMELDKRLEFRELLISEDNHQQQQSRKIKNKKKRDLNSKDGMRKWWAFRQTQKLQKRSQREKKQDKNEISKKTRKKIKTLEEPLVVIDLPDVLKLDQITKKEKNGSNSDLKKKMKNRKNESKMRKRRRVRRLSDVENLPRMRQGNEIKTEDDWDIPVENIEKNRKERFSYNRNYGLPSSESQLLQCPKIQFLGLKVPTNVSVVPSLGSLTRKCFQQGSLVDDEKSMASLSVCKVSNVHHWPTPKSTNSGSAMSRESFESLRVGNSVDYGITHRTLRILSNSPTPAENSSTPLTKFRNKDSNEDSKKDDPLKIRSDASEHHSSVGKHLRESMMIKRTSHQNDCPIINTIGTLNLDTRDAVNGEASEIATVPLSLAERVSPNQDESKRITPSSTSSLQKSVFDNQTQLNLFSESHPQQPAVLPLESHYRTINGDGSSVILSLRDDGSEVLQSLVENNDVYFFLDIAGGPEKNPGRDVPNSAQRRPHQEIQNMIRQSKNISGISQTEIEGETPKKGLSALIAVVNPVTHECLTGIVSE